MELTTTDGYRHLLRQISDTYTQGQVRAVQAVSTHLIETYWQVGRHIVEFEQAGQVRAEYGTALIQTLASDLGLRHGKGFSRSNLVYMRLLYLRYPISQKPSHQLSWSHYVELLKLDDELERGFYERQAIAERWSVPELKRQKAASLFLRLAASQDKEGILQLARQGQMVEQLGDPTRKLALRSPSALFAGAGQGLHVCGPPSPGDDQQHALQGRSGFLPPHPALLCAHRFEARRSAAPRHRPDEPVPGLLRR
jgi:hypothetical protein